ncbi:hypothetical protein CHS0354_020114 [Potamilus streckersoni]|uniref:Uncharacterized protein n=1 Tax=Potamilus streckersoni TaxID=2493646 RepID=A0AAE0S535_9BIVA|nr:hypothetical protein CHS0354_020114 [Potamilus streckersoni]
MPVHSSQKNVKNGSEEQKRRASLKYMQKPPTIMPNYGKNKPLASPKTNISRVLLYDNVTQQQMLDVKLAHIKIEKQRASRLLDMHKRSFWVMMKKKHQQMFDAGTGSRSGSRLPALALGRSTFSTPRESRMYSRSPTNLSLNVEELKLPTIGENEKHIVFKVRDKNGNLKIYHTFDDRGIFSDIVPLHTFYSKTTDDPRFQCLEEVLIRPRSTKSVDGFVKLSPTYVKEYPRIPEHVQQMARQSSLGAS